MKFNYGNALPFNNGITYITKRGHLEKPSTGQQLYGISFGNRINSNKDKIFILNLRFF
ncbi:MULTISPECIES: hypothetical protein [Sphingobacterium]|uniref:hypothetical protein n=1 Tax=Sphingobacterium TaxID=28453 RepID=UPI0025810426|nr:MULTISPECIES: hypothetical protein [Sphingobacterium]